MLWLTEGSSPPALVANFSNCTRFSSQVLEGGQISEWVIWSGELCSPLLGLPLLKEDGSILPRWMMVLLQTKDVALHSVAEGNIFEGLEIVLGKDLTAGALPHVALLSETQGGGKRTRGMQAYQVVSPIVDAECAEGVSTWVDHVWSHKEIITAARPWGRITKWRESRGLTLGNSGSGLWALEPGAQGCHQDRCQHQHLWCHRLTKLLTTNSNSKPLTKVPKIQCLIPVSPPQLPTIKSNLIQSKTKS